MGEKLLSLLSGYFTALAVVFLIATMILILGPQWGIRPPWNWITAIVLVVLGLIGYLIHWIIQKRREKQFEEGILGQAQQDMSRLSVARRAEVEALVGRWKEAIRLLKESNARRGGVLRQLPWFAIIGEPQSGKSTLLRNSGLDFPIGDAQIHGIGGTKNCDWWFANEAIILDTAGRYAFEVQSAPDREEWTRFLTLLKKTRRKGAINGLLVTVPADSLLSKNDDELRIYAQHLRGKINDMMTKLGIAFPVYLVVTKVDLVEGFVGFFSRYPANRVREAVGRTFDNVDPKASIQGATKTLDELYDRLCSMSLGLMEEGDPGAPARPYLMYPEEFRNLGDRLKIFIEGLLRENIYMRNPIFRGCYITSGTQEGRTIAAAVSELAGKLGLDLESLTTVHEAEQPKRAYFVRDLLSKILIEDARRSLVRPIEMNARQRLLQALGTVILPTALVSGLLLLWAFAAFGSNRAGWADLRDYVVQNPFLGGGAPPEESKVAEAISALDALRAQRAKALDHSSFASLFLTRSDPADAPFNRVFTQTVEKYVLGPTIARMRSSLEGGETAPAAYIEDLAVWSDYRRMVKERASPDPAALEGLAGPWSRPDDRFGVAARRKDLGALVAEYVRLGGQETGSISFDRVAVQLQAVVDRLQEKDPYVQVRDLARSSAPIVRSGTDAAAIEQAWGELKRIVAAGSGAVKVGPDTFTRIDRNLSALDDGAPALVPLRRLAGLVGGPGAGSAEGADRQNAFGEQVLKPLQEARDLAAPACPAPDAGDPASVDKVAEAIGGFAAEIGKRSEAVQKGITAFNAGLASGDQIDDVTVAGLARRGRMTEVYRTCTQGWFDADGPLSTASLYKAAGGATGGGGAPQWVGPPGGAFQCLHPKSASAAVQLDTATLDKVGQSLKKLSSLPDVPSDLGAGLSGQWSGTRGSVGGGGRGTNYTAAIGRIELAVSPNAWTIDVVPDQLRAIANDGTLKAILDEIKKGLAEEGKSAAPLRSFSPDAYAAALNDIADRIEAGLGDATGLELLKYASEIFDSTTSSFDKAVRAASAAPNPNLGRQMDGVVRTVWEKLLERSAVGLDAFYKTQLRTRIDEMRSCYPFSASGAPCDAVRFNEMFGPDGPVAKLAGFAAEGGSGPRTKFGKSLPIGPGFQRVLRSAARIFRAYGAGKEPVFEITFEAKPAEIVPEGKIKRDEILVVVQTSTLTLGGATLVPYDNRMVSKIVGRVPVEDNSGSALDVALDDERERRLGEKLFGGGFTTQKAEAGDLPQERGTWSFLKLLERGRTGQGNECCVWQVPLQEKDKKKEKIATVRILYTLIPPRGTPSILDPSFWKLEAPPEGVSD